MLFCQLHKIFIEFIQRLRLFMDEADGHDDEPISIHLRQQLFVRGSRPLDSGSSALFEQERSEDRNRVRQPG